MGTDWSRRQLFVLVACLAAAAAGAFAQQATPRIAPRDQLSITVVGVKDWSNKYPVGLDGTIEFPEIGRIKVAGLTARDASDLLVTTLKSRRVLVNPQITVEFEQTPNKKVTVTGLVRNQGAISYAGELSLLNALVRAGGRLPEAADDVLIVRPLVDAAGKPLPESPKTISVNARDLERGQLSADVVLQDGDQVFVRKAQAVTVTGYVRNVGAYNVESGMNVEQVLALAGGIDPVRGSDKRIEITRKVNGKTVTLKDVRKTDLVQPGDIIKVGRRWM